MIKNQFWNDIKLLLTRYEMWIYMALVDIRLRYRRTKLGPFWLVIVSFVTIVCLAALGTILFRVKWNDFFPYVATGMVSWNFIAAMLTDSSVVFLTQVGLIKHVRVVPLSFCMRMFVRNAIIYLHSLPVVMLVLIYYKISFWKTFLLLIPNMFIIFITASCVAVVLGFLCTRFRDIIQLITALMGILAFMTPIMWRPEMLNEHAYLVNFNPFSHYVALMREPLLGNVPSLINYSFTIGFSTFLLILANYVYNKYSKQIVHWL